MPTTAAQEEFNALIYGTGRASPSEPHPEDRQGNDSDRNNDHSPAKSKTIRDSSVLHSDSDSDTPSRRPGGAASAAGSRDPATGKMRPRYYVPTQRSAANTGPKGVIADAQAFQQARRAHRSAAASRANLSVPSQYAEEPKHDDDVGHDMRPQSWLLDVDEDDEDSEDDEFLVRWRQNRLKEMASGRQRKTRSRSAADGAVKYGSLVTVDAHGYLDAIEKVGRDTVVVVFIYDEQSEVSQLIEQCVWDLARRHTSVRFVKLHYEEAQMEPAGVPAILAYRGGDKFAGLVPVLDEMMDDDDLSADTLAAALRRHSVLA